MSRNTEDYWKRKDIMAARAYEHYMYVSRTFPKEIQYSTDHTEIFDESTNNFIPIEFVKYPETKIEIVDMDSVSAIFQYKDYQENMALLNFASYKNPGGMFMKGSTAQEECLCHSSTLCNVLNRFPEFYNYNKKNINNSLYTNRALYSPRIIFGMNNMTTCCDIITCAAPNKYGAEKYHNVSESENSSALFSRIRFVLNIAKMKDVDILILGAYGCGVFGQNSFEVASIFKQLLETEFKSCFKKVIFAIPFSYKNQNLQNFLSVFNVK